MTKKKKKKIKKKKIGIVVSTSMDKTIVVEVESRYSHSIYSKTLRKTKKYLAHDPENSCHIGEQVVIQERAPLSKRKCWELIDTESLSSSVEFNFEGQDTVSSNKFFEELLDSLEF